MKIALAICCLAAVVVFTSASNQQTSTEIIAEIEITTKECAEKFKISTETLEVLEATIDKISYNASDDLKCFNRCVGENVGLFVDGKLVVDRLIKVHIAFGREESKIREYAENCKDLFARHVDCNSSWDQYTCFHNQL